VNDPSDDAVNATFYCLVAPVRPFSSCTTMPTRRWWTSATKCSFPQRPARSTQPSFRRFRGAEDLPQEPL